jgi:hypothetical protein
MSASPLTLDPHNGAQFLTDLGFLLTPDVPDESVSLPAYLLVALRAHPTLGHFDPERVDYWVNADGRGCPATFDRSIHLPFDDDFGWGMIRIVDRLDVSNEYLAFGGHVSAAAVDGVAVAVFASPAPILCRGGHSQTWDPGSASLAAFFARLRATVGISRAVEARVAAASPMTLYAAWVEASAARYRMSDLLRAIHPATFESFERQERNLRSCHPAEWSAAHELVRGSGIAIS